jgi:hypothetical protein
LSPANTHSSHNERSILNLCICLSRKASLWKFLLFPIPTFTQSSSQRLPLISPVKTHTFFLFQYFYHEHTIHWLFLVRAFKNKHEHQMMIRIGAGHRASPSSHLVRRHLRLDVHPRFSSLRELALPTSSLFRLEHFISDVNFFYSKSLTSVESTNVVVKSLFVYTTGIFVDSEPFLW